MEKGEEKQVTECNLHPNPQTHTHTHKENDKSESWFTNKKVEIVYKPQEFEEHHASQTSDSPMSPPKPTK